MFWLYHDGSLAPSLSVRYFEASSSTSVVISVVIHLVSTAEGLVGGEEKLRLPFGPTTSARAFDGEVFPC